MELNYFIPIYCILVFIVLFITFLLWVDGDSIPEITGFFSWLFYGIFFPLIFVKYMIKFLIKNFWS